MTTLLLIQARRLADPMAHHELEVFAQACGVAEDRFRTFNIVTDPLHDFDLRGVAAVLFGGSGDFSLVQGGFEWHGDFLELIRRVLASRIPTFGSCFGFQGILQALGGKLATDPERSEVGTFEIRLTEAVTEEDRLFGALPATFDAQLGHNDSVIALPAGVTHLASSDRCFYQAIRVDGLPVVATQFHPELTREGSLARFLNYLQGYKQPGQDLEEAIAYAESMHRPSPHASSLLQAFTERLPRPSGHHLTLISSPSEEDAS